MFDFSNKELLALYRCAIETALDESSSRRTKLAYVKADKSFDEWNKLNKELESAKNAVEQGDPKPKGRKEQKKRYEDYSLKYMLEQQEFTAFKRAENDILSFLATTMRELRKENIRLKKKIARALP